VRALRRKRSAGATPALTRGASDADAYGDYLPRERIFLCGPQAGAGGTRAVRDWAAHLEELLRELPAAQPPIPNVNIFF
jgi:hypothetical protein